MQNKSYCLGLDISSTVVGYCVSSSKNEILDAGYVDIHKETSIKDKAHKVAGPRDIGRRKPKPAKSLPTPLPP